MRSCLMSAVHAAADLADGERAYPDSGRTYYLQAIGQPKSSRVAIRYYERRGLQLFAVLGDQSAVVVGSMDPAVRAEGLVSIVLENRPVTVPANRGAIGFLPTELRNPPGSG